VVQEVSVREAYGKTLVELGKENPDIVVLDADLSRSTMTQIFAQQFPERFFDCGIAEQNMVGIAAGLAASGKIPFASTFAVFAPGRCFDQIRMSIAQPGRNVKIVTTHGGISVGEDGTSHQAIEDLALICSLPGFSVIILYNEDYCFNLGKAVVMRPGNDATIIAIGIMVKEALDAAEDLKLEGIDCCVLNMPTLKPIDEEAIITAAAETGAIVTAEEHLEHGGLGSKVAQVVTRHHPVPMELVAIRDTYTKSGKFAELLQKYGLTATDIGQAVRGVVKRK